MSSVRASAALCFALAFAPSWARAEPVPLSANSPAQARKDFVDAEGLLAKGKVKEACALLANSFTLFEDLATLANLASCYEQSGEFQNAAATYKEALERAGKLNDPRRPAIQRFADALNARMPTLAVSVSQTLLLSQCWEVSVTVNGKPLEKEQWGQAVAVNPGKYKVVAHDARGAELPPPRPVDIHPGDHATVVIPGVDGLTPEAIKNIQTIVEEVTKANELIVAKKVDDGCTLLEKVAPEVDRLPPVLRCPKMVDQTKSALANCSMPNRRAVQVYLEAVELFGNVEQGNWSGYARSCDKLAEAVALDPRPKWLFELGTCHGNLGEFPRGLDELRRAKEGAEAAHNEPLRLDAANAFAQLTQHAPILRIEVAAPNAKATIQGETGDARAIDPRLLGHDMPMNAGTYTLVVAAAGNEWRRTVHVEKGERTTMRFPPNEDDETAGNADEQLPRVPPGGCGCTTTGEASSRPGGALALVPVAIWGWRRRRASRNEARTRG